MCKIPLLLSCCTGRLDWSSLKRSQLQLSQELVIFWNLYDKTLNSTWNLVFSCQSRTDFGWTEKNQKWKIKVVALERIDSNVETLKTNSHWAVGVYVLIQLDPFQKRTKLLDEIFQFWISSAWAPSKNKKKSLDFEEKILVVGIYSLGPFLGLAGLRPPSRAPPPPTCPGPH